MKRSMKVNWMALLVIAIFVVTLGVASCSPGGSSGNRVADPGVTLNPGPNEEIVTIKIPIDPNICGPGTMCSALVTPGVPPDEVFLAGTAIDRVCYDPYTCAVDYSGSVSGGNLAANIVVPVDTILHIIYSLANQLRIDGFTINGTLLYNLPTIDGTAVTNSAVLGTAPQQYGVACFIINRDQAGAVSVHGVAACDAQVYQMVVRTRGDSNLNGVYDPPYDDPVVPYVGTEDIRFQTSLWLNPSPGGIWQQLVWDGTDFSETFFTVLENQAAWFALHHPARDPVCVANPGTCPYESQFSVFYDVYPLGGGALLCTVEAEAYVDLDPADPAVWYGPQMDGIVAGCPTQGADTRTEAVGL